MRNLRQVRILAAELDEIVEKCSSRGCDLDTGKTVMMRAGIGDDGRPRRRDELRHMSGVRRTDALGCRELAQPVRRDDNPRVAVFLPQLERSFVGRARLERDAIAWLRGVERRLQRLARGDVNGAAGGCGLAHINGRLREGRTRVHALPIVRWTAAEALCDRRIDEGRSTMDDRRRRGPKAAAVPSSTPRTA